MTTPAIGRGLGGPQPTAGLTDDGSFPASPKQPGSFLPMSREPLRIPCSFLALLFLLSLLKGNEELRLWRSGG